MYTRQTAITSLLLVSCIVFSKEITLNPDTPSASGASITTNHSDVTPSPSGWYIEQATKEGFQLELSLDDTWGFRAGHKSTIQITINSDTPLYASSNGANPDLDALFAAFISNQHYIAFQATLDNNNEENAASPGCDHSPITMWDGDVVAMLNTNTGDRRDTIFHRGAWQNGYEFVDAISLKPNRDFTLYPNQWPLIFTFENDPINDILNVSFTTLNGFTQFCLFNAFATDSGLNFFMALDDNGEIVNYKSFTISESYEQTPSPPGSPTLKPSHFQSVSPTNPTSKPTVAPTKDSSSNPSKPTDNPSISPTPQPTVAPSLVPSIAPFESQSKPESDTTSIFISVAVIISILIVVVCIAIVYFAIKLWRGAKEAKEVPVKLSEDVFVSPPVITGDNVAVAPATIRGDDVCAAPPKVAMVSRSSGQNSKESEESFEVFGNDETPMQGYDGEEEAERKVNELGEGISVRDEAILERVFATNQDVQEDSFEIIGDDETPMDHDSGDDGDDIVDGVATVEGDFDQGTNDVDVFHINNDNQTQYY